MPDLSLADYRALAEFRYQIRAFLHFSEEQARAHGVEPQQHQLLLAVRGLPEGTSATVGELALRLQLKHHTTVELIDRLEARAAVTRTPSTHDRRQVIVALTPGGRALLRSLSLTHREEIERTAPALLRALKPLLPSARKHKTEVA